jgi:hypothetical protein
VCGVWWVSGVWCVSSGGVWCVVCVCGVCGGGHLHHQPSKYHISNGHSNHLCNPIFFLFFLSSFMFYLPHVPCLAATSSYLAPNLTLTCMPHLGVYVTKPVTDVIALPGQHPERGHCGPCGERSAASRLGLTVNRCKEYVHMWAGSV